MKKIITICTLLACLFSCTEAEPEVPGGKKEDPSDQPGTPEEQTVAEKIKSLLSEGATLESYTSGSFSWNLYFSTVSDGTVCVTLAGSLVSSFEDLGDRALLALCEEKETLTLPFSSFLKVVLSESDLVFRAPSDTLHVSFGIPYSSTDALSAELAPAVPGVKMWMTLSEEGNGGVLSFAHSGAETVSAEALVSVSNGEKTCEIPVRLTYSPFLWEDGTSAKTVADNGFGGEVSLSMMSGHTYEVKDAPDWIDVACDPGCVTLSLSENLALESREATLTFVAADSELSLVCTVTQCRTDKAVLLRLFDSLDGENWVDSSGWGAENPLDGSWYGIGIDSDLRVTSLLLGDNHLRGELPEEIYLLSELRTLDLCSHKHTNTLNSSQKDLWNEVTGEFHASRFPKLEKAMLFGCTGLGGDVEEFWGLPLTELKIRNCSFTGKITPKIATMTALRSLDLDSNNLSGTIPEEIAQMTWLEIVKLGNDLRKAVNSPYYGMPCNAFEGGLPEGIGNMKSLRTLWLYSAGLSGCIPESFYDLSSLSSCDITNNAFSGTLDGTKLGSMPSMSSFYIIGNPDLYISGDIPSWVICSEGQKL